jgi:hypothetical protein
MPKPTSKKGLTFLAELFPLRSSNFYGRRKILFKKVKKVREKGG